VAPVPEGLSLQDAGALGLAGTAALDSVNAIAPDKGQTVLISGATGAAHRPPHRTPLTPATKSARRSLPGFGAPDGSTARRRTDGCPPECLDGAFGSASEDSKQSKLR
jgi:hypothetical protein